MRKPRNLPFQRAIIFPEFKVNPASDMISAKRVRRNHPRVPPFAVHTGLTLLRPNATGASETDSVHGGVDKVVQTRRHDILIGHVNLRIKATAINSQYRLRVQHTTRKSIHKLYMSGHLHRMLAEQPND